jgi:hypothetical protein
MLRYDRRYARRLRNECRWVVKFGGSPFVRPPSERAEWLRCLWHSKRRVFRAMWMMAERRAAGLCSDEWADRLALALAEEWYNLPGLQGADGGRLAGVERCRGLVGGVEVASAN